MTNRQKYIVDTTLRDGEQSPGIAFSIREKVTIAKSLDALGVSRIEAGTPAMGREECRAFEKIKLACQKAQIIGWNRMNLSDISQSIAQACEVPEVKWRLKSSVVAVDDSGVTLDDGHHIEAKTVIWTTGVRANT